MDDMAENETNKTESGVQFSSNQIIGATAGLLGILGNGLVCFVLIRFRSVFKSVTNKLMLHQSSVDFVLSMVMLITRLYTPWDQFYCRFTRGWLYWGLAQISTSNLMLIACDRYVAVCYPIKYRQWFSITRVKIYLIFVWAFPVLWQSYLMWVHVPYGTSCLAIWSNDTARLSVGVATFIWEYLMPLTLMTFTYTSTILALRQRVLTRARNVAATQPAVNGGNASRQPASDPLQTAKVRLTITFMLVAMFFIICWSPTEITWLLYNFGVIPGEYYNSLWHLGLETPLLCLNTCVNPVIYSLAYTHFRQHLNIIFCGRCKNKVGDVAIVENVTEHSSDPHSSRGRGKTTMVEVNA